MDEKPIPEHGLAGQFIADAESHILLSGSTQISGKTMATNRIVEKFYELGYTIIHITDVKSHKIEAGFAAFKTKDKKHRLLQKEFGVHPRAYPIKKYHVLTRDIPTKAISDTHFFTIPFKHLDRDLLRFVFDNPSKETTIETIGSIISGMGNTDTVFELYYQLALRAGRVSDDKDSSGIFINDPESYHLNINTAEKWALKLITKKLDLFQVNGIQLTPLDYGLNLDIAKLVRDRKTYHLFHDAYIKDEKLRYFRIMYILLQIYEYAKGREIKVLIVMEEIRNFLKKSSEKAEGWKKVLSDTVSDLISKVASMGIIIVATTQVITDLDSGIQQILPQFLIGKTSSSKDARMIQLNWSIEAKEAVHALRKGEFMIMRNKPSGGKLVPKKIVIPVSAHCHPERNLNFERMWKKHYPDKVQSYRELRNTYRDDIREWNSAYTKKVKVELRKQHKKEQAKKEAMEAKQLKKDGLEQSKTTLAESSKQMQANAKQHVIMECMAMQNTLGKVVFNQVAKNNDVHPQTVKKWWLAHQKGTSAPAKPVSDKGIEILQ